MMLYQLQYICVDAHSYIYFVHVLENCLMKIQFSMILMHLGQAKITTIL